jgi:hypothetical protein
VVPIARTVWLWPLTWIELDDINVYKPGYDSHPPRMQKAWTAEEKAKWRIKMRNLNPNYDQSLNPGVNYEIAFRKLPKDIKIYKPTTIRLNKAGSVEEQWKAVLVPLGGGLRDCKRHKVQKMFDVVRTEQGKLSIARRQGN